MKHAASMLLTLCACLITSRARAELTLRWQAPPECPQQRAAERAIARELNGHSAADELRAEVVLERIDAGHWRARLRLRGALEAARDVTGDACAALADTAAWLIADALRSLPPSAARPDGPWQLALALRFDSGTQPRPAPGLGLRLSRALAALRLALEARVLLPNELALPAAISGGRARFVSAELALSGCYAFAFDGVELGPCVDVVPGMIWARSSGFASSRSDSGPSLSLEAGVAASFALAAHVRLRVELVAARPVWFPRFTLAPLGLVHQPDAVIARGAAGLALRF
jgi:hypothetical protein